MKNYFLNRQINRIEREANNDFLQILSFGARCYPTKELHQLLRRLDEESQKLAHYRRMVLLCGGTITASIALCFLFQSLNLTIGVYFTLSMIPISILAFVIGNVLVNRRFKAVKSAQLIEKIIVEELDRRRKDASIY